MADEDWPRYNRTNTLNLLSERESSPDQQTTGSNVGGDGFARLHEWGYTSDGESIRSTGEGGQMMDEYMATGAVLVGRRTAEQADHWGVIITVVSQSS
jgi:hypothetical protein